MTGLLPYSPLTLLLRLLPDRCASLRCALILGRALFPVVWPFIQSPGFPVRVVVRVELIGVVIEVALSAHNHLPIKSWRPHIHDGSPARHSQPKSCGQNAIRHVCRDYDHARNESKVGLRCWNWRKGLGNWKAEMLVVSKVSSDYIKNGTKFR